VGRAAFVLTVSDQASAGGRVDESGPALAARLERDGFTVARAIVPDEEAAIAGAVRQAAPSHRLVVITGGTGVAPRDVTPQALRGLLDYEIPGFGELMRAEGRRSTPFASLSRSLAGVVGRTLVVAVPGNVRGATESLEALAELLPHALELLGGDPVHHAHGSGEPPAEAQADRPPELAG
jgi:molybdenum cofactor synthesis domain-containing protein